MCNCMICTGKDEDFFCSEHASPEAVHVHCLNCKLHNALALEKGYAFMREHGYNELLPVGGHVIVFKTCPTCSSTPNKPRTFFIPDETNPQH